MNSAHAKSNVNVSMLVEFFSFRTMLMPRIIILLNLLVTIFGLAALVCLPAAMIYFAIAGGENREEMMTQCGVSFVAVLIGMIAFRLAFEYLILFFRMNETLTELLRKTPESPFGELSAASAAAVADIPPHQPKKDFAEIPLTPPEAPYTAEAVLTFQPENEIRPGDIVFDCPFCGHNHAISPKGAGITINCVKCGKPMTVPTSS